jgi:hypothetical protein
MREQYDDGAAGARLELETDRKASAVDVELGERMTGGQGPAMPGRKRGKADAGAPEQDQRATCPCGVVARFTLTRQRWTGSSYRIPVPESARPHLGDDVYATAQVIGDGSVKSCQIVKRARDNAPELRLELIGVHIRDVVVTLHKLPAPG